MLDQLQPDVIVVLGDVFAEGFKATDLLWWDYLHVSHPDTSSPPVSVFLSTIPKVIPRY